MLFAYLCINLLLIYGFPTKSATRLSFLFNAYNEYVEEDLPSKRHPTGN